MKLIRSAICITVLAVAYAFFIVGFVLDRVAAEFDDYHEDTFR